MSRILVVDDERTLTFEKLNLTDDWRIEHVRTNKEAIIYLNFFNDQPVILFLDHDLGPNEDTMALVSLLIENKDTWNVGWIYVHSMNPVGRDNIIGKLKKDYVVQAIDLSLVL